MSKIYMKILLIKIHFDRIKAFFPYLYSWYKKFNRNR